jgi:hypothetical protein
MQVIAVNDIHLSGEPPLRDKPKGQSILEYEKKEISLGSKGEKKGTRRCSTCGYYATHNLRTCLKHRHNRERLEAMQNKMRGKP